MTMNHSAGASECPEVDAVIAVHSPSRPIERAVGSILDHTQARVRVTVVIHNTDPDPILARLALYKDDPRLRIDVFADGIPSPAGPMNRGFDLADAEYTTLLGSDDTLEPGAIDAWLAASKLPGGVSADMVIAPSRDETGRFHPSPPVRWTRVVPGPSQFLGRSTVLDGAADRLAYRAAPLGLIGRARFAHLRFAEGMETGEDQPFSAELWFSPGSRVVFPALAPAYREHADQLDRVTRAVRDVEVEFRVLDTMLDPSTVWSGNSKARLSLAVKLIRVHLFDAVQSRLGAGWSERSAVALARVAERILEWEPRAPRLLARVDERLLDEILAGSVDERNLGELLSARSRLRSPAALLPRRLRYALHRQAPLRHHLAGALLLRRVGREQRPRGAR